MYNRNRAYKLLISTLRCGLKGESVHWRKPIKSTDFSDLFTVARIHSLLPMVVQAVCCDLYQEKATGTKTDDRNPDREELNKDRMIIGRARKKARRTVIRQAQRTADFLLLYDYLAKNGLHPLVMKGIICRNLYPIPEQRPSVDEDLLIQSSQFSKYHDAFIASGFSLVDPSQDFYLDDEVAYQNQDNHLYIELHKHPFPSDSEVYGDLNRFFEGVQDRCITEIIHGTLFYTLGHTDHLLYLILHVYKHFLHSGFGIRQVCDIILYSESYQNRINWEKVRSILETCHAFDFACAIYRIGDKYLIPENNMKEYLKDWMIEGIDEKPLLNDILEGGLYGGDSLSRLHSSNMTLHAVTQSRLNNGNRFLHGVPILIHSIFLPRRKMEGKYPYVKKAPFLLPIAWIQRLGNYLIELCRNHSKSGTVETIRLGNNRIKLLQKYHIIE